MNLARDHGHAALVECPTSEMGRGVRRGGLRWGAGEEAAVRCPSGCRVTPPLMGDSWAHWGPEATLEMAGVGTVRTRGTLEGTGEGFHSGGTFGPRGAADWFPWWRDLGAGDVSHETLGDASGRGFGVGAREGP